MKLPVLSIITFAILLPACSTSQPNISVACEENAMGNSIMKWETTPTIDGHIKVYASTDPNHTSLEETPVAETTIGAQKVTIINKSPSIRFYYTIVFNDEYPITVATRNINMNGVQNFRDIGGYAIDKNKGTIWGKLYRSAQIDSIQPDGLKVLKGLGIRTIIDLRSPEEEGYDERFNKLWGIKIVHIPFYSESMLNIIHRAHDGTIINDSIQHVVERINIELVSKHAKTLHKIFKTLLDKNNYPIVVECSDGKARTGIATAIILSALGANYDVIMQDYQLSNLYFDITKVSHQVYNMPESVQEAITTLFAAKEDYLDAAFNYITDEYGDMNHYLNKAVGLSPKEIKKLKTLLVKENNAYR